MKVLVRFLFMWSLAVGVAGCSRGFTADGAAAADGVIVVVPSRTLLKVVLLDGLDSDTTLPGDTFLARLVEPIVIHGTTVAAEGTILSGLVLDSAYAGMTNGNARIGFALTGITQGERTIPITTNTFSVTATSIGGREVEGVADGVGFTFGNTGTEIHYGADTRMNFTLSEPVALSVASRGLPGPSNVASR